MCIRYRSIRYKPARKIGKQSESGFVEITVTVTFPKKTEWAQINVIETNNIKYEATRLYYKGNPIPDATKRKGFHSEITLLSSETAKGWLMFMQRNDQTPAWRRISSNSPTRTVQEKIDDFKISSE